VSGGKICPTVDAVLDGYREAIPLFFTINVDRAAVGRAEVLSTDNDCRKLNLEDCLCTCGVNLEVGTFEFVLAGRRLSFLVAAIFDNLLELLLSLVLGRNAL
jgi:hypothetical protein